MDKIKSVHDMMQELVDIFQEHAHAHVMMMLRRRELANQREEDEARNSSQSRTHAQASASHVCLHVTAVHDTVLCPPPEADLVLTTLVVPCLLVGRYYLCALC